MVSKLFSQTIITEHLVRFCLGAPCLCPCVKLKQPYIIYVYRVTNIYIYITASGLKIARPDTLPKIWSNVQTVEFVGWRWFYWSGCELFNSPSLIYASVWVYSQILFVTMLTSLSSSDLCSHLLECRIKGNVKQSLAQGQMKNWKTSNYWCIYYL